MKNGKIRIKSEELKLKGLFFLILNIIVLNTVAQNGINSPYSRYGLGMMSDRAMGFNKAMSGVAQGFSDGQQINVQNPASYAAIDSLTALFDLGFSVYNGNYQMGSLKQNAKNSSFDYFAFQFRVRRGVGVTLGILPYTNIKYSFTSSPTPISSGSTQTQTTSFTGDGGLHQVFIGAGWSPFKRFSIGANASYLYGDYTHNSTSSVNDNSAFGMQRSYTANLATWKLDIGLQYTVPLTRQDDITIGATYGLGHDIHNRALRTTRSLSSSSSTGTEEIVSNAFGLPHSIDAGLTYRHGTKWRVGADFSYEKWSDVLFPTENSSNAYVAAKGQLYDRTKAAIGAEYTPNVFSAKYLRRIAYRAGAYYSQSYARTDISGVLTEKPYEFGLSAGLSLPIQNSHVWYNTPRLNLTFSWVHSNIPYLSHQSGNKTKLTEDYLRFSVGITFSERWFSKWKVQ